MLPAASTARFGTLIAADCETPPALIRCNVLVTPGLIAWLMLIAPVVP